MSGRPPLGASLEEFGLNPDDIVFVPGALGSRPELAMHVTAVLAHWAWTEYELTALVTVLLRADFAVASEFVYAVGWERRRNTIKSLARRVLAPDDFALVQRAFIPLKDAANVRHDLGHGLWGTDRRRDDLIVLAQPKDVVRMNAAIREEEHNPTIAFARIIIQEGFVARARVFDAPLLADLEQEAQNVARHLSTLNSVLNRPGSLAELRAELDRDLPPLPRDRQDRTP